MLFSNPVLFELPVLPRVQKFIRAKLTDPAGNAQPMLASPQALGPGLMLWAIAQSEKKLLFTNYEYRPGRVDRPVARRQKFDQKLTAQIGVGIAEFHPSRSQYLLNYVELEVFSNMVDHMIQNELVQYCQQEMATAPMTRIKSFCDQYDFTSEELSEDALKQMYLRYRKQTGASCFSPEVSRSFAFVPYIQAA